MKIEIDILDEIPSPLAIDAVRQVIEKGKISKGERGKMYYCWATIFSTNVGRIVVSTRQYTKNDCFVVWKKK